ncbi:Ig-like domain-containing protein [Gimesia fumaroli]|uniref:Chromosome partition protein Smc n=1 Tax=Gimesia fumaroli TaxID=2527976 RepID=A0A518IGJ0_9PLAN|nr:Ig-like domain-containing protein [Gimesia fumaroli]QDV52202.1 Chromosome partition protein Smc [Gimesia fumaroli]
MLRALGIIFLVLLGMLIAVGGGVLSHFLVNFDFIRLQSPLVQHGTENQNKLQQPIAPETFSQSEQVQAIPIQRHTRSASPINSAPAPNQQALTQVSGIATSTPPAVLTPLVLGDTTPNTFKIVEVASEGEIIWTGDALVNKGKKQILLKATTSTKITLEKVSGLFFETGKSYTLDLKQLEGATTTVSLQLPVQVSADNNQASFVIPNSNITKPGSYQLKITSLPTPLTVWTEEGGPTSLVYPKTTLKPVISIVSVHKYGTPNFVPATIYEMYDGYLRVRLSSATGNEKFIFVNDNNVFKKEIEVINRQRYPNSSNVWQYELNVPTKDITFPGTIYALLEQDSAHAYSTNGIKVNKATYVRDGVGITSALYNSDTDSLLETRDPNNYFTNQTEFKIKFTVQTTGGGNADGTQLVVNDSKGSHLAFINIGALSETPAPVELTINLRTVGKYTLVPMLMQGNQVIESVRIDPIQVSIATQGPIKGIVDASLFSQIPSGNEFTISFDKNYPLDYTSLVFNNATSANNTVTVTKVGGANPPVTITSLEPIPDSNAIKIKLSNATSAGNYQIQFTAGAKDLHGIALTGTYDVPKLVISDDISLAGSRGITGTTGNYVPYPEYTNPRENSVGFNPSDKVVTRIARLYYFRDAHRVAQIINRKIRSYNRHGVDMKTQLAGVALKLAEAATDLRKRNEKAAINAAVKARQSETKLEDLQQSLARRSNEIQQIQRDIQRMEGDLNRKEFLQNKTYEQQGTTEEQEDKEELRELNNSIVQENTVEQLKRARLSLSTAQADSAQTRSKIQLALAAVETARAEEIRLNDEWDDTQRKEERAYAEEFRKQVAAAHEDPDSYAEGSPKSDDPVEQVSISVIGTGLIQLRGPLKGVNEVRTMINQIDAPVGQVRISLHTIQINGEHGDRMEVVASKIQRYIDHARFLTSQSAQILRNSIVKVASQKAANIDAMCPDHSQHARDLKYVEAFFGADFLQALHELDSEFLKTGNKLLSLNSMDSTSLSSALFMMALAKNSVRMEILADFQMQIETQLPQDEQDYFIASGMTKKHDFKKFHFMAHNAKFVSLRGFFNADVAGDDTLTPLQREFIRLAQIFKSRLVTEIELKERILERSVIEDRIGNYKDMRKAALSEESDAKNAVRKAKTVRIKELMELTQEFQNMITVLSQDVNSLILLPTDVDTQNRDSKTWTSNKTYKIQLNGINYEYQFINKNNKKELKITNITPKTNTQKKMWNQMIQKLALEYQRLHRLCNKFHYFELDHQAILIKENGYFNSLSENYFEGDNDIKQVKADKTKSPQVIATITIGIKEYSILVKAIEKQTRDYKRRGALILANLKSSKSNLQDAFRDWLELRDSILAHYKDDDLKKKAEEAIKKVNESFREMFDAEIKEQIALELLEGSRLPLDHKKFLDMLVDDVEEKFIELVEGTRAHTANIDNYMQRIATALEDDFNTQFYRPAFRYVRETSRYWDVSFAQVDETSILTNNRQFARVSPQATMEFDLPQRDIMINEAFESALAAYSDYGALMNDPNFLALTKLYGGQPASATYTAEGTSPRIRNVLSGTPSVMDEEYLSQGPSSPPKFGSQLEGLIPDPSVYKFETGTAFEVRPVIQPDGQAVVFHLNYEYTTNIREPVRADEKHLGRVKRHFIDTDVQTGNYELREVSRYQVALKASRTSRGVPFLEDVPGLGVLFRPLPQAESALQENIILAQSVIYPTLFDIMGLRWAPAVADLDTLNLRDLEFVTRNRQRVLRNKVSDFASSKVDGYLDIPEKERRGDLYRTQQTIPYNHPSGYTGPGLNLKDSTLQEGYRPQDIRPPSRYIPGKDPAFVPGAREIWTPPADTQNVPLQEGGPPNLESDDSAIFQKSQTNSIPSQSGRSHTNVKASQRSGSRSVNTLPPASPVLLTPPQTRSTLNHKNFDKHINQTSFEEKITPVRVFKFSSPLKALKKLNFMKSQPKQAPGHVRPIGYETSSKHPHDFQQKLFGISSIVRPDKAQPISTETRKPSKTPSAWSRFSERLPKLPYSKK